MKPILFAAGACAALLLAACDPDNGEVDVTADTPAVNAGEQVGEAVEDAGNAVQEGAENVGEAVDGAVDAPNADDH